MSAVSTMVPQPAPGTSAADDPVEHPARPSAEHLAAEPAPSAADRASRARAVLARAEERTGAARWIRPVPQVVTQDEPEDAAARQVEPERTAHRLEVPGHLAHLLPSGGLDRGTTVVVTGSTSLTLALLSEASRAGSWVAVVGQPGIGVLAAYQLGLRLDRVALVPAPGPDGPTVVAALLDGVDVVVVGPQAGLTDSDRRRLSARARERSAVLLSTAPWRGAHVVLAAEESRWEGLGRGHGRLRSRRMIVHRSGRGTAAVARRDEVLLPIGRAEVPAGAAALPSGPGRRAG